MKRQGWPLTAILAMTLPAAGQSAKARPLTAQERTEIALPAAGQSTKSRPLTAQERAEIEKAIGHPLPKDTMIIVEKPEPLCYTMRVYEFRRSDEQAPVLNGETDCVAATSLKKRARTAPRARYLPE